MSNGLTAKVSTIINYPASKVWDVLVNPEMISQFMVGAQVDTDWKEGSSITWTGVRNGQSYQDKGIILKFQPEKKLVYSHFSSREGLPDQSENYHTLTYELYEKGENTLITLSQDNNLNNNDLMRSQKMWETLLSNLKMFMEK